MKGNKILRKLEKSGFIMIRQNSSHRTFRGNGRLFVVSIGEHDDVRPLTIRGIEKDAGITLRDK